MTDTYEIPDGPAQLRRARGQARLTQEALASSADVSRITVSRIENGHLPRDATFRKLQAAISAAMPQPGAQSASPDMVAVPRALWAAALREHLSVPALQAVLDVEIKAVIERTSEDWMDLIHVVREYPHLFLTRPQPL